VIGSLARAALAVVVTPVAAVADVLTLPASSLDPHRGPFDRTAHFLKVAGRNVCEAVEPPKEER
jgi:hypothetical protein